MPGDPIRRMIEPLRRTLGIVPVRSAVRRAIGVARRWRQEDLALALGLCYQHWREGTIGRAVAALLDVAADATRERLGEGTTDRGGRRDDP